MLFRNRFLSTTAYSLAISDEQKVANQKQRDSIEVLNIKKVEPEKEVKEEPEEKVEIKEEEKEGEDKVIETIEEKVDELEDKLDDKTLTAKEREKLELRIEKERKKAQVLRNENEDLKRQLAAKPDDEKVLTEDEVERRSEEKANQKTAIKELNASIDRIVESCKRIDKDYKIKIDAMCEEAGSALPQLMIGILDDMPNNGGPVLMYLAKNVDEYEEIYKLHPAKMALKLKEISDKVNVVKKKEISKVPEPKDPVGGKGATPETKASEKDDMETFVRKRNQEVAERRKARMGMH